MTYDELTKKVNMKNAIEGSISTFLREKVNDKENGAEVLAAVIYNTMDKNYKGQNNFKLLTRKIADKGDLYFEDVASYAIYLFTMDYTNRMLKDMPEDPRKSVLIKAISTEVSRGLASLNMYIANDIQEGVYRNHAEKTRKIMGVSNEFNNAFGQFLIERRTEVIDSLVNM